MVNGKLIIEKFSIGTGDRFANQAKAQLSALMKAGEKGIEVVPVWNKSHREHTTIGSEPASAVQAADEAVKALDYQGAYYCDADHINLSNVDLFIDHCNFFTLDVADYIQEGESYAADNPAVVSFCEKHSAYVGAFEIEGISETFNVTADDISSYAQKYLPAVKAAGEIYSRILEKKGEGNFVTEVSMDETDFPQTPVELFFILAAVADENIPAQTIAPRFSGRFNKGVDYVGDRAQFAKEFELDIAVISKAVKSFGLPENLKLSVHSGSDKFSIYGPIAEAVKKFDAGLHLKTAGTTWLEEVIGLAEAGGEGLKIAKEIYSSALEKYEELCAPYATVIDIDPAKLPAADEVNSWSSEQFVNALRHDQSCTEYNPNLRQLIHVGYKVAAKMGERYIKALSTFESEVAKNVGENIYDRHLMKLFS
ncbi:MAG: tagaturonate epimerase family protein [Planctomycetota bacterium]